ncbi:MAG: lysophospholipid acyltransferase family protein [Phycisphaera sp.]|nr:lysophospholipid acyltransferase family protein [Phycisphaera sp.]
MTDPATGIENEPPFAWQHVGQYLPLRALAAALQLVDPEQNLRSATMFGKLYAKLGHHRTRRAFDNIRWAMPDLSEEETARIATASIEYMFRLFLVDTLAMPRLVNPWTWQEFVELDQLDASVEHLLSDRPMILISGHCGNWELLGYTLATLGFPMTALARPLDNPLIYRWLLGVREARGLRVLTKWGATKQIQELVQGSDPAGRRVAFIADQNAGEGGLFVPYFDRMASSYKSIGLLAMRYELPIVVGTAIRLGERFRYRIKVQDRFGPEDWCDRKDPLFYITARFNHALENLVRQTPEQYLWIHRRWKSRPKWEHAGKPIPSSVMSRLESLPWMTQDSLERIVESTPEGRS